MTSGDTEDNSYYPVCLKWSAPAECE